MSLRLLAVHAHPDDESSKGSATYASYIARGDRVMVVSCTGGESGDVLNDGLGEREKARAARDMAGLRFGEMARAREILGVEHRWLGYVDSGLPGEGESVRPDSFAAIPLEASGRPLVRIIREFRPQVLLTYDENGGYPHPDHIRAHEVSMWAMEVAASDAFPELGEPWSVSKLYYDRTFSMQRMEAVATLLEQRTPDDPRVASFAEMRAWRAGRPEATITTRVPCADFFDARDAALRAHASQVAPDDRFFFWPNELLREAWPTEDYELVRSSVDTTLPEDDLFAGIIERPTE